MKERAVIENDLCQVEVAAQAGEVHHYLDKENSIDYCWSGNPGFWANRNPVLFPLLGGVENGEYTYEGQTHKIGNHGVLRHALFEITNVTDDTVTLQIAYNKTTLAAYPFKFRLQVAYTLKGKQLNISYILYNEDDKDLPFEFGFHPAFNIPFTADKQFSDYQLIFEQSENLVSSNGFVKVDHTKTINLSDPSLFDRSLSFFFSDFKSNYIDLTDGNHTLRVGTADFEQLGIWHRSPSTPFICIEPWRPRLGLKQKPFFGPNHTANLLPAGQQVEFGYYFEITK